MEEVKYVRVCFNDSVKGSLAFAQHCENDVMGESLSFVDKGIGNFFAKRKALKEYRRNR